MEKWIKGQKNGSSQDVRGMNGQSDRELTEVPETKGTKYLSRLAVPIPVVQKDLRCREKRRRMRNKLTP